LKPSTFLEGGVFIISYEYISGAEEESYVYGLLYLNQPFSIICLDYPNYVKATVFEPFYRKLLNLSIPDMAHLGSLKVVM
jgi:hypothetical protein